MRAGVLFLLAVVAFLGSGCAGRGGRSQLARLQSQLGLLDERVTQLERMGTVTAPGFSTGDSSGGGLTIDSGASSRSSAITVPVTKAVKQASAGKPSTRQIQQALKEAGFYQGSVDGKMGPLTRQAVEEFQRVNGLAPDGVVGRQTWTKLKQYAELSGSEPANNAYIK